ncbi:MAG: indole-3-glycerol phosphate synthase TrpC [bacterium]
MFLEQVILRKREELSLKKNLFSLRELQKRVRDLPPPRNFQKGITSAKPLALIAEIKRASPSAGWIQKEANIAQIAQAYAAAGAAAISVLTESGYFHGSLFDLPLINKNISLPILQKDFFLDPFQIYEGRNLGADAILLIVKILSSDKLKELMEVAQEMDLGILVEIHDEEDLEKIDGLPIPLLGINNRNLKDLTVDLKTTFRLLKKISHSCPIISESGIKFREDVLTLQQAGVQGILVGEILMRSPQPSLKIKELLGL